MARFVAIEKLIDELRKNPLTHIDMLNIIEEAHRELRSEKENQLVLQKRLEASVRSFNRTDWTDPDQVESSTRVYMAIRILVDVLNPGSIHESDAIARSLVNFPKVDHPYYKD